MTDKHDYKAGGIVTVRLDADWAWRLNNNKQHDYLLGKDQILSYEPPKEPIVWYSRADKYYVASQRTPFSHNDPDTIYCKHTYDPTTREIKSEIVK